MKQVIDGKVYNTDTAEKIAGDESSLPQNDFRFYVERLYRTKKGAFFLEGEGGPMTRWAEGDGSGARWGGSGIHVLTQAEALQWCEIHDVDADTIAEYFDIEEA